MKRVMCTLCFVFLSLRHVSDGPVRVPRPPQRHRETDPEWLKCHSAERQQSGPGSRLEVWEDLLWIRMKNGVQSTTEEALHTLWQNENKSVDTQQCCYTKVKSILDSFQLLRCYRNAFSLIGIQPTGCSKIYLLCYWFLHNMGHDWLSNKRCSLGQTLECQKKS